VQQSSALPTDFERRTTPQNFQFTPRQEEWLTRSGGNPNRQDPYILYRMARQAGGPLPPVTYFRDPADQAIARRLGFGGTATPQTQQAQPQTQQAPSTPGRFEFSPQQEAWLTRGGGNPNRQDPYILNRMPGPKPPVSYFTDPQDQAIARSLRFPTNESYDELSRIIQLTKK
jgi:hypothetical protein